jgi:hypothetical protein
VKELEEYKKSIPAPKQAKPKYVYSSWTYYETEEC